MSDRLDAALRAMRKSLSHVCILPDPDAQRRKQYALAERIASASFDFGFSPKQWQLSFNTALREIQRFDREFEEVR